LSFKMASNQQHLIERAAARLAETQVTAFQSPRPRPSPEPRRAIPLDLPSRVVVDDEPLDEAAARVAAEPISTPSVADERQIEPARLAKAGLIRDPASRVSEEFRIVQNRVLRQSFGDASATSSGVQNIVMITSALKGEGKSFVSLNLAGEIARQGDRRVLLLDVDPKPDSLSRILGVESAPGLLELARDVKLDIADIIIPTAAEGLDIAPVGQNDGRSGEVLASPRMGQIIQEIGRRYADRLIILDAPPCLASSAPHALAPVCGQAVLVVAANNTQQSDIEAALDLLQTCPHVSLLLNKVAPWMTHSFGTYSYLAAVD
jgi:protein-tyrosine kinase